MGINVGGGMIVGCEMEDLQEIDDDTRFEFGGEQLEPYEYFNEVYDSMSPFFDSPPECWTVGTRVKSTVAVLSPEFDEWVVEVKRVAQQFEEEFGVPAKLFGMQNVR